MGCDIHGVFEVNVKGKWWAFDHINNNRRYAWFGILSGVRYDGPFCDSQRWDPRDNKDNASVAWLSICTDWGPDLHSHSLVTMDALEQANEAMRGPEADEAGSNVDYEPLPDLDALVDCFIFGGHQEEIKMRLTLREIMELPATATMKDQAVRERLRMVVAYDN